MAIKIPFGRTLCSASIALLFLVSFSAAEDIGDTPASGDLPQYADKTLDSDLSDGAAQDTTQRTIPAVSDPDFLVPQSLAGRVDFWRLVYMKYDKHYAIMHFRSHPEVIYSVLNFQEPFEQMDWKVFVREKERRLKAETERIRASLKHLATGLRPRDDFERRLEAQFSVFPDRLPKYREAQELDQIRSQTGIREKFAQAIARSGRYIHAIESIFSSEGLPPELARLPYVESSFDYEAYSSAGAAGIWQFMRSTGKSYLRISASIDERRDPILASRAAAKYLSHSFNKLGRWPLAVTSYNHGLNGIMRAVKETGSTELAAIIKHYKGESFGFASSNFFCEFLAALDVDRNAARYFPEVRREAPWHFDEVRLSRQISYRELVIRSGMSEFDIERLNPALLKPVTTNRVPIPAGFLVKVSKGRGEMLVKALQQGSVLSIDGANKEFLESMERKRIEAKREAKAVKSSGSNYKVQPGDSFGSIAKKFSVSSAELMRANGISDPKKLRAGKVLIIPRSGPKAGKGKKR